MSFYHDSSILTEFQLQSRAEYTLDLDLSTVSIPEIVLLAVDVLDETGTFRVDIALWLEGLGGPVRPLSSTQLGHIFLVASGRYTLHVKRRAIVRLPRIWSFNLFTPPIRSRTA